ncbi:MAG: toll/interleukin-1 receptor domain-containing protein [Ktedonobacterales bacterium]|nr:toll/interleukin-1 receptor domain-containing protein [Ktedonobacterales bacterium]
MRIFISYSHQDWSICAYFLKRVRSEGKRMTTFLHQAMKDVGEITFWVDREALKGGVAWREEICEAISACDIMLLFVRREVTTDVAIEMGMALGLQKIIVSVVWEGIYNREGQSMFGSSFRDLEAQLAPYQLRDIEAMRWRDTEALPILELLVEHVRAFYGY